MRGPRADQPASPLNNTLLSILVDPTAASLKRLAWAYGCARKGSDVEARLLEILVDRVRTDDQSGSTIGT